MPPSTITIPEKINRGMASRIYLLMESNVTWVSTLQGKFRKLITTTLPDRPNTRKMGTERKSVMTPNAIAR